MTSPAHPGDIHLASSDEEILACFPVMRQLRPHLVESQFLTRVRRQMAAGYRIAWLEAGGRVVAVAGYRFKETLFLGRFVYVDDLVTDAEQRSRGHGQRLFAWLVDLARREGCSHLELDSGMQREDAHRFYLRHGMRVRSHHFSLPLQ